MHQFGCFCTYTTDAALALVVGLMHPRLPEAEWPNIEWTDAPFRGQPTLGAKWTAPEHRKLVTALRQTPGKTHPSPR